MKEYIKDWAGVPALESRLMGHVDHLHKRVDELVKAVNGISSVLQRLDSHASVIRGLQHEVASIKGQMADALDPESVL